LTTLLGSSSSAARRAMILRSPISYVTERCVFALTAEGLELTEVAPGIDIQRHILAHMHPPGRR
jgi:propionate CoA-transferase